eukprot:CAMPEP_0196665358 /NCGR_PEP_ID=MMETSP1086-20130531/60684_1 /TAXON_ID=77921 /ORGANISM="Cyanoptyche  gloeocystis , Strain SAG4.97" /LENGTH=490 /DNA_ID=CAMNT_0042002083 /DNA_START=152 /DNA_END=1624 /DNA_ORIENTATION=-
MGNMWGLLNFIALFGYGCVDLPKLLWNNANPDERLAQCHIKASQIDTRKTEARAELAKLMNKAVSALRILPADHPMEAYLNIVVGKCPVDFDLEAATATLGASEARAAKWTVDDVTYSRVSELHRDVKAAILSLARTQTEWQINAEVAFDMEDVLQNRVDSSRRFRSSWRPPAPPVCGHILESAEWYWKVRFRKAMYRASSLLTALLSGVFVWSEIMIFANPRLSAFAYVFVEGMSWWAIQVAAFSCVGYMAACAYYTLFRLKLFNFVQVHFAQQTDPYSLLFVATLVARIAAPLCYNFLSLINAKQKTYFHHLMGSMDAVPLLGSWVNAFVPCLVVVFVTFTAFNLWSRLLSKLPFGQHVAADPDSEELLGEGQRLLKDVKRRLAQWPASPNTPPLSPVSPTSKRYTRTAPGRPHLKVTSFEPVGLSRSVSVNTVSDGADGEAAGAGVTEESSLASTGKRLFSVVKSKMSAVKSSGGYLALPRLHLGFT